MAILKLLRNSEMFATREAALNDIILRATSLSDGEMWIASYGTNPNAKTILAVKRNYGVTVFDNESINDVINSLDYSDEAVAKSFVTSVSETNGVISVTRGEVTSNDKTIDLAETNGGGIDFAVNIDGSSLVKDSNDGTISVQINSNEKVLSSGNNGLQTTIALKKVTTGLSANIKEQYQLVGIDGTTQLGNVAVDIYKDSALLAVKLSTLDATWDSTNNVIVDGTGEDALVFAYEDKNGQVQVVAIPVGDFLRESEFKDGLQVDSNNGEVSVKIDANSETLTVSDGQGGSTTEAALTVSIDGVKVGHIQDAIDYSIGLLDTTVTDSLDASDDTQVASGSHVGIKIVEEDGIITSVDIVEDDIASAADMNEIERVVSESLNDLELRKAEKTDFDNLSDSILEQVEAGNGIQVSAKSDKKQTISLKLDDQPHSYRLKVSPFTVITAQAYDALSSADKENYEPYETNALVLTSDGLYMPEVTDCGTY